MTDIITPILGTERPELLEEYILDTEIYSLSIAGSLRQLEQRVTTNIGRGLPHHDLHYLYGYLLHLFEDLMIDIGVTSHVSTLRAFEGRWPYLVRTMLGRCDVKTTHAIVDARIDHTVQPNRTMLPIEEEHKFFRKWRQATTIDRLREALNRRFGSYMWFLSQRNESTYVIERCVGKDLYLVLTFHFIIDASEVA